MGWLGFGLGFFGGGFGFFGFVFLLVLFWFGFFLQFGRAGHAAVEIFGLNTFFASERRGHAPSSSLTLARELRKIHLKRL